MDDGVKVIGPGANPFKGIPHTFFGRDIRFNGNEPAVRRSFAGFPVKGKDTAALCEKCLYSRTSHAAVRAGYKDVVHGFCSFSSRLSSRYIRTARGAARAKANRSAAGWARYTPQIGSVNRWGRIRTTGMNISP